MSELLNSETGWLNFTNIVLGLAVLACIVALARVLVQDLRILLASRARTPIARDDHAFSLASLGITMADGGVVVDEKAWTMKHSPDEDDEPNIIRSVN